MLNYSTEFVNPLTPNDHYSDRTAPLTSKCCILYIYLKNTGTEYFKYGIYLRKEKNQLDATYFIIYSILIHCSTCFGR